MIRRVTLFSLAFIAGIADIEASSVEELLSTSAWCQNFEVVSVWERGKEGAPGGPRLFVQLVASHSCKTNTTFSLKGNFTFVQVEKASHKNSLYGWARAILPGESTGGFLLFCPFVCYYTPPLYRVYTLEFKEALNCHLLSCWRKHECVFGLRLYSKLSSQEFQVYGAGIVANEDIAENETLVSTLGMHQTDNYNTNIRSEEGQSIVYISRNCTDSNMCREDSAKRPTESNRSPSQALRAPSKVNWELVFRNRTRCCCP
jgi:hypothetical protein